jgi:peroxiredoxin
MDDLETMKKFKAKIGASFPFIPDPQDKLVKLFGVKMPVVSLAKRYSFVIGPQRKIIRVDSGNDALNPDTAIAACPIPARNPSPDSKRG